jgi:hypothetical protein
MSVITNISGLLMGLSFQGNYEKTYRRFWNIIMNMKPLTIQSML